MAKQLKNIAYLNNVEDGTQGVNKIKTQTNNASTQFAPSYQTDEAAVSADAYETYQKAQADRELKQAQAYETPSTASATPTRTLDDVLREANEYAQSFNSAKTAAMDAYDKLQYYLSIGQYDKATEYQKIYSDYVSTNYENSKWAKGIFTKPDWKKEYESALTEALALAGDISVEDAKTLKNNLKNAYKNGTTFEYGQSPTGTPTTAYPENPTTPQGGEEVATGGEVAGQDSTTPTKANAYDNYYDTSKDYQTNALSGIRDDALNNALVAYQKTLNPYGARAEALSEAGLSPTGGYANRMNVNAYNNYADSVAQANNIYQQGLQDLDLQLAQQRYQDQKEAEQRAYQMELYKMQNASASEANDLALSQQRITYATQIGQQVANSIGNKAFKKGVLTDDAKAKVIAEIRNANPSITENEIQTALLYITK